MCFIDIINRMKHLDSLIKRRATGCPQCLCKKINISERSVFNLIEQMKNLGAPIAYDSSTKNYYYETPGEFTFKFLPDEDLKTIEGGINFTNYMSLQNYFSGNSYLCIP